MLPRLPLEQGPSRRAHRARRPPGLLEPPVPELEEAELALPSCHNRQRLVSK
ncbi:MAG: hypothetical protein HYV05_11295 [Deltaproteobacteria bacterium]|nr:hypothetical protein [Deltaproteobacteria bacterium]MBI2349220.1 hypothetical protein [Deltaproteobacteria bacterium]MBI2540807.1 hypothetical protein [Deltaproteobacteria bacterium]MBI3061673.1 hypothetical protein [Deltaproteobacteria bacterium]